MHEKCLWYPWTILINPFIVSSIDTDAHTYLQINIRYQKSERESKSKEVPKKRKQNTFYL